MKLIGFNFSGATYPQVLLFLSHVLFIESQNTLAPASYFTRSVIRLCLYQTYHKCTFPLCFFPSIFTYYASQTHTFLNPLSRYYQTQGEVQTPALNHTVAMSPSNIQWCMDVPIKNTSNLHSLDTFLLQKGLIVCLQLFGKSNEAEKRLDHL